MNPSGEVKSSKPRQRRSVELSQPSVSVMVRGYGPITSCVAMKANASRQWRVLANGAAQLARLVGNGDGWRLCRQWLRMRRTAGSSWRPDRPFSPAQIGGMAVLRAQQKPLPARPSCALAAVAFARRHSRNLLAVIVINNLP